MHSEPAGAPPGPPTGEGHGGERIGGVWELAWPTMLSFSLQAVVGIVDMLFVSQLGSNAVAGVGLGSQIHFLTFALFSAITTGTVALVARAIGAGDLADANRFLQVSLWLVAAAGIVLAIAAPLSPFVLAPFGVSTEVTEIGGSYLRILLFWSLPLGVGVTLSSAMRGAGDMMSPLLIGILANVINIVGDYMLIFGNWGAPAMGTDGSAVASAISFAITTLVYFLFWWNDQLAIPRGTLLRKISWEECKRIVRIGLPTAGEQVAFNLGIVLFLGIVTTFGTDGVSAYMIGARILAFAFIPGFGFATAAATLVGQHLGAGNPLEAARAGWRSAAGAIGVMSSVGFLIIVFAEPISKWFGAAGENTAQLTVYFIYILGAAQPLMAIEFTIGGALRGAGDTRFPLIVIMTGLFVFRLGGSLALVHFFEPTLVQVWSCLLADYSVKALMLSLRFKRGRWKSLEI